MITPKFTEKDIRNFIRKKVEVLEEVIFKRLRDVGEMFVADARSINTYKDQTSNLRSSIGYSIIKDGVSIFGNFELKNEGHAGFARAQELVAEIQSEHPFGFALIVVAGMDYAIYVEAKSKDVITGSSFAAETEIKRVFDLLKANLRKVK